MHRDGIGVLSRGSLVFSLMARVHTGQDGGPATLPVLGTALGPGRHAQHHVQHLASSTFSSPPPGVRVSLLTL